MVQTSQKAPVISVVIVAIGVVSCHEPFAVIDATVDLIVFLIQEMIIHDALTILGLYCFLYYLMYR